MIFVIGKMIKCNLLKSYVLIKYNLSDRKVINSAHICQINSKFRQAFLSPVIHHGTLVWRMYVECLYGSFITVILGGYYSAVPVREFLETKMSKLRIVK